VAKVRAVGLVGDDLFGPEMLRLLSRIGVDASAMLRCQADWQTAVYAKPHVGDVEGDRIDFGAFNRVAPATVDALAAALEAAAEGSDAVIVNQQIAEGVLTAGMAGRVNEIIARHPGRRFLVDARHHSGLFRGAMLKLNAHEACRLAGQPRPADESIGAAVVRGCAAELHARAGRPVFVTRGAGGIVVADAGKVAEVPAVRIAGPVDPVGAGDTAVAAIAAAMAVGATAIEAARLANLAAGVTVQKLHTTGTASPDEIRRARQHCD
jgi:sugar/nucleoside kinase (ribokinase family)